MPRFRVQHGRTPVDIWGNFKIVLYNHKVVGGTGVVRSHVDYTMVWGKKSIRFGVNSSGSTTTAAMSWEGRVDYAMVWARLDE